MPSRPLRVLLVDPGNSRGEINEPIGIAALTATLEAAFGPRVRVEQRLVPFDGPVHPGDLTLFDLVGLSTSLGSLAETERIVATWRGLPASASPLLVLGGLLATFAPDELVERCPAPSLRYDLTPESGSRRASTGGVRQAPGGLLPRRGQPRRGAGAGARGRAVTGSATPTAEPAISRAPCVLGAIPLPKYIHQWHIEVSSFTGHS